MSTTRSLLRRAAGFVTPRSRGACRRVLHALVNLSLDGPLRNDPKWESTLKAAHSLGDALAVPHRMKRY